MCLDISFVVDITIIILINDNINRCCIIIHAVIV